MSTRSRALAALAAAMILVGSSVAVGQVLVSSLPLHFASMIRFALATAVLIPVVVHCEGGLAHLRGRTLALLALQALCGSFLFTICLLSGLRLTGAADAGVMASATPAAVAVLGRLVFRERLSGRAVAGLVSTVAGIAVVQAGSGASSGPSPLWGNALVLCAVGFEAVFLLLRRAIPEPLSPLAAAFWVSALGLVLFLIPGLCQIPQLTAGDFTAQSLAALAYYGLGVTAAAYMLWFYGVVRVDAATAGVMTGIMPLAALGSAALVCGETVGWRELAGCAGVVAGVLCLARSGKPPAQALSRLRGRA